MVLFGACVGALEHFWRSRSLAPALVDDAGLWAQERSRVYEPGAVVLVGASRLQLGIHLETLRRKLPGRPIVQLAIDGTLCDPVLEDLARDPDFRGTVLVSWLPFSSFPPDAAHEYLRTYHTAWGPAVRTERALATWVQTHVTSLRPALSLPNALRTLGQTGELPRGPTHVVLGADRGRLAYYDRVPADRLAALRREVARRRVADEQVLEASRGRSRQADAWAREIAKRGGRVVFLLMPLNDPEPGDPEEGLHVEDVFRAFAAEAESPTLDATSIPVLAAFPLPDGSHLDGTDAPSFTELLVDELLRRKLLGD
ncbi:MAG: hypothetical protein AB7T63_18070 [Planctomycetota bacterium]